MSIHSITKLFICFSLFFFSLCLLLERYFD